MSLSVRIRKAAATIYTFTIAPFVAPSTSYEYTTSDPPHLVSLTKTWTLEGIIYGTGEADVSAKYAALIAVQENATSMPDGLQIVSGATVVEQIGTEGGYRGFGITKIAVTKSDLMWRGELRVSMTVQALKVFAPLGGTISALDQRETYSYDEAGLLTHTLTGTVTVTAGSALAIAQTLGLTLPGTSFGYSTNGPGGVDVEIQDLAGFVARFTCVVVQNGESLPAFVAPSFTRTKTVERTVGETHTTITVRAVGAGAVNAVAAERPGNCVGETLVSNTKTREASGTFIAHTFTSGSLIRTHTCVATGGGRPIGFSERTGGRPPAKHKLPLVPAEIVETIRIEILGTPGLDDFRLPAPLDLDEDTSQLAFDPMPTLSRRGPTPAGNLWIMGVRRVYRAPVLSDIFKKAADLALGPEGTKFFGDVSPTAEVSRKEA